jgi:hypothetical protein
MKFIRRLAGHFKKDDLSRRELLTGAGKVVAGAAGVGIASAGGLGLLTEADAKGPEFPWGYKKIDPVRAGKIAYENWYRSFCCYGTTSGILLPLQQDIGAPYTSFPLEAMIWGHGGAVGWGSLCGCLTGAGMATALIAGHQGEMILNEVMDWYTKEKLPIYKPARPRAKVTQINRSGSALCHISVGKWMAKEKASFHSPERMERCARLTADVTMKTVELLNRWADGKFKPSRYSQVRMYQMPTENKCRSCHSGNEPDVPGKI